MNLNGTVILHGAGFLREVGKAVQWQIEEKRFFFLKHLLNLPFHPSVNPFGRPLFFPVHQPLVLLFNAFKSEAFQSGVLRMLNRIFHAALAIRVGDTARISHGAVMRQNRGIQRV